MDQRIIDLYDGLTHGDMSRRDFIDQAARIVGTTTAAAALIPLLQCDYAKAATIDPNDARLINEKITYDSPKGKITGYLSRPKSRGKRPAIVVIHQNRGVNPHIEDIARRLGSEGFLALAPDLLSPLGGTPADPEEQLKLFAKIDRTDSTIGVATVAFLKKHNESTAKVGVVGFCFGGSMVKLIALNSPDLDAAVSFYGSVPADLSKVKDIRGPFLDHFAGLDKKLNEGIPRWEEAMKAANKRYTKYMYEGANHAFNDDTAGPRYDKKSADLAWGRTLAFFKENLGTPPNAA